MKMIFDKLAVVVSRVFDPFVVTVLLLVVFSIFLRPHLFIITTWIGAAAGFFTFFLIGLKLGWFGDWEISKRSERHRLNLVIVVLLTISLIPVLIYGESGVIFYFAVIYVWFLVHAMITFWWKISAHTGLFTITLLLVNSIFNWQFVWGVFVLSLIGWSRVYRKKHSLLQVFIGMIAAVMVWGIVKAVAQ